MRACLPATRARHTRPPRAVPHSRVACAAWFLFAWLQGAALAQETLEPARLRSGSPPVHPARVIAWGQEWLRVSVDAAGQVQGIAPLTQAPAFSEVLHQAVREWSFFPAREDGAAVLTEVLVVGVFRPAMLHDPPGLDRPTSIPQPAGAGIPVPLVTPTPPYPPRAQGDGTAVVEVEVNRQGTVAEGRVVTASQGFAPTALNTARRWRFRPATHGGQAVPSVAYVVFSFREPVIVPPIRQ